MALLLPAAATAAGNHMRHRHPDSSKGCWLAGAGGTAMLSVFAYVLTRIMDLSPAFDWRFVAWWTGCAGIGLCGVVGSLALLDPRGRTVRLGRILARWGLALWMPYHFASFFIAFGEDLAAVPYCAFAAIKGGGPDLAFVVALGAGLGAGLEPSLSVEQREQVADVFS
jgi:hypothetical protein